MAGVWQKLQCPSLESAALAHTASVPREGKDKHWVDRSCENKEMTL